MRRESNNQADYRLEFEDGLKLPPHSTEAEQATLGGLMLKDDAYWDVCGIVQEPDFYRADHRVIFRAITALVEQEKPRDVLTLMDWLGVNGLMEKAGGVPYVGALCTDIPSAANIKAYAQIVAERSRMRQAIAAASDAISTLYDQREDPAETISSLQSKLEAISISGGGKAATFRDVLKRGINMIDRNRTRRLEGKLAGVPYGLKALDECTGGMRGGQLIAIAGRPSLGKTALSHQIALNAAQAGYPIGEISLEMSQEQLAIRSFANRFRVNGTRLMFGYDEQIQAVSDGLQQYPEFRDIPLYVDSDTYDFHAITSRIVEWHRKHNVQAVIIDHIGLIRLDSFTNKVDRLGHITNNLKRLAKRLDIAVNIITQLNRSTEKEMRRPVLSDYRDCGEIEQDIDVGIFLHSEDDEDEREIMVDMGVLKNRDGHRGWNPGGARFRFRKAVQVFEQAEQQQPPGGGR
jgi:replicative DNA helicase